MISVRGAFDSQIPRVLVWDVIYSEYSTASHGVRSTSLWGGVGVYEGSTGKQYKKIDRVAERGRTEGLFYLGSTSVSRYSVKTMTYYNI